MYACMYAPVYSSIIAVNIGDIYMRDNLSIFTNKLSNLNPENPITRKKWFI